MDQVIKEKLQKAVTDFSTVCVSAGYKMRSKGLTLPDRDMDRLVQQAVEPLLYLFKELYDSREEYQKAADTMAMEHKVEREKLIDALVECRDAFVPPEQNTLAESLWNDSMLNEDGIAPYVVNSVIRLNDDMMHHKISAVRNAKLAVEYYTQLQRANMEIESLKLQLKGKQ